MFDRSKFIQSKHCFSVSTHFYIPNFQAQPATAMTRFRPCIDLHAGQVKQIVGGTLTTDSSSLKTNFTSTHPAAYYANLYKDTNALGSHVIMLGPGNSDAAREALQAWPGKLQIGGGITDQNAAEWIDAGAEKVCTLYYTRLYSHRQSNRWSSRKKLIQHPQ